MELINYKNSPYEIKRHSEESNSVYSFRVNYIKEKLATTTHDIKILERNSKILSYTKFKKCFYTQKII